MNDFFCCLFQRLEMNGFAWKMSLVVVAVGAGCGAMLTVNRGYGWGLAVGVCLLGALVLACHSVLVRRAEDDASALKQSQSEVAALKTQTARNSRELSHQLCLRRRILERAKRGLGEEPQPPRQKQEQNSAEAAEAAAAAAPQQMQQ